VYTEPGGSVFYCSRCTREVVIYGISHYPGAQEHTERVREELERDGKLVLFNPPPFGPYQCPACRAVELEEKAEQ
jgi:hypothetical protein